MDDFIDNLENDYQALLKQRGLFNNTGALSKLKVVLTLVEDNLSGAMATFLIKTFNDMYENES